MSSNIIYFDDDDNNNNNIKTRKSYAWPSMNDLNDSKFDDGV